MINTIKSFIAPLLAATILTMGGGLLNSLLSINMSLSGYSEKIIGLVMSCNYMGVVLGIFFCEPIVQRVGYIRSFTAFAAVVTAIALMYGIYMTPWFWAFLRICTGISITGLFMVIESWLNEKVEPMARGRLLSVYMILVYFGNGCGQLLLNIGNVQGKSIFMVAGILFAICLIPISITRAITPQPLEVPRYNLIKLFQLAPFSMAGSLTAGMISGSFYAIGPMFALKIGLPIAQVSLFMSLTVWSGLLFQWPVGFLSDRFDRLTVLSILGFIVLLVSVFISVLGSLSFSLLLLLTACFGIIFSIYPVAMARAQDNIDKKDIVPVSGALILFFGVGAGIGPVLSSLIIAKTGPWGLYHFTAICGGILGGTAWIFRKKLPSKVEDQVPFIPIPKTSPVVSTFDPRGGTDDHTETENSDE